MRVLATVALLSLMACAEPQRRTDAPGLRVADVLGANDAGAAFARANAPREFQFPTDHGAHLDFRSEWWYLTLALEDADGREFGVQFTIFRQASYPGAAAHDPWRNGQGYLGHFAITDVQAGAHQEAERLSRGHPALAGAWPGGPGDGGELDMPASVGDILIGSADCGPYDQASIGKNGAGTSASPGSSCAGPVDRAALAERGGFAVWLEGWRLSGVGGDWRLDARTGDMSAAIDLKPTKPIVAQGERGLSAKGPGQASYYYSVPRLRASGSLGLDGVDHQVQGIGWLDREWSTSVLGPHQVGWDWFALMLDSGEDIMAFRLRRDDGTRDPYDHGVLVDATGRPRQLGIDNFDLQPLEFWRDERGSTWPTRWALVLDERRWEIVAPVRDQRMDTLLTYWEGLVHVRNAQGERVGRGYMELTGY